MDKEDKKKDWCGPEGHWISKAVPDKIGSAYLGECCKKHDEDYAESDRRKHADLHFRICIRCRMRAAGYKFLGTIVSWYYYITVRLLGWMFHNGK